MKQNDYIKTCIDRLIPELVGPTITGGVADDTGECANILFPCYMERGTQEARCSECPWELQGKEEMSCLKH